jgi:hypothetical protein
MCRYVMNHTLCPLPISQHLPKPCFNKVEQALEQEKQAISNSEDGSCAMVDGEVLALTCLWN